MNNDTCWTSINQSLRRWLPTGTQGVDVFCGFFFFNILDENSYFLLFSPNWLWMTNPGSQVLGRECLEELSTLKCWISINEQSWHRFGTDLNLAELVSHAHWFLNFTKKKKDKNYYLTWLFITYRDWEIFKNKLKRTPVRKQINSCSRVRRRDRCPGLILLEYRQVQLGLVYVRVHIYTCTSQPAALVQLSHTWSLQ